MKAAICYAYGKPLVIEDIHIEAPRVKEVKVRVAAPRVKEVKVRVAATAICHSDIHVY